MKQRMTVAAPQTRQTCMTPDKLDKAPFSEERKNCQRTIVNSTSKLLEFHEEKLLPLTSMYPATAVP